MGKRDRKREGEGKRGNKWKIQLKGSEEKRERDEQRGTQKKREEMCIR